MKRIILLVIIPILFIWHHASAQTQHDWEKLEEKADSLKDSNNFVAAVKLYEKLIQNQPKRSYLLSSAGYCYYNLENYNKAKEKYSLSALYRSPDKAEYLSNDYTCLSAVYVHLGNKSKQLEYAQKAYQVYPMVLSLWNFASALSDNGKSDEAIKLLNSSKLSSDVAFNGLYGVIYYRADNYKKADYYFYRFFVEYEIYLSEMKNLNLGEYYEWAWYNLTRPLVSQDFEQPLLKADSAKMLAYFGKLIEYKMLGSIMGSMVKEIDFINEHTNAYNSIYLQLIQLLSEEYCIEKIGILTSIGEYEKAMNITCLEKYLPEKKKVLYNVYQFIIAYQQFAADWKSGKTTVNDNRLSQLATLFSQSVGNRTNITEEMIKADRTLEGILETNMNVIVEKGKKDPTEMRAVLDKICTPSFEEKFKNQIIERIINKLNR